jgi:nucleoside triphosphatase
MLESKYPEPTVGGLIFDPEGRLLLIRSHKWKDQYSVPGGHIELGERIEDALQREIKEETGLDIFDLKFIAFQEFIYDDAFWKKKHFIFFDYYCKTRMSEVTLNEEAQDYIWAELDTLFELPLEPYTKIAIERYLEKFSINNDEK